MLTFNFHHSDPIVLDKVSKDLIHEVTRTIDLDDLKHIQVLHKSTRELDIYFEESNKVILVLNLIGSLYRAEAPFTNKSELGEMIMKFTKFTYQFKAYYPFKLTKSKTAEQAYRLLEDDSNSRSYDVDDYSQNDDYSQTGSDKFSFDKLTETIRNSTSARKINERTPSRKQKKSKEIESPFGSIGKIISFFIKAIIIIGLLRTCSKRFGNNSDDSAIPQMFTEEAKVISVSELPAHLAGGTDINGNPRDDWKVIHYSYEYGDEMFKNQRIVTSAEIEALGNKMPKTGDKIEVRFSAKFPSLGSIEQIKVTEFAEIDYGITHEFVE